MSETQRRPRRKTLTDKMVAALPRKRKRYFHPDPELPSHGVRVLPDGPSSFYVIARDAFHKQRWVRIGSTAEHSVEESREIARSVIKRLRAGLSAFEPPPAQPDSFAAVAENWLKRHVEAKGLRTGPERRRVLEKYVLPHWRDCPFTTLRRSDVARLLDAIEDAHGHWVADSALSVLRSLASWHSARDDDYVPPFTRGMRRTPPQASKRSRILSDAELRVVWKAAAAAGAFGGLVQLLLLTAQRRAKLATMRWDDVADDGTWTISTLAREKGNAGTLRLPPLAMKIIAVQPRLAGNPYVFAGRGDSPLSGFSARHTALKQSCGVDGWTLHDCRRTARSLLSRTNVRPDIAERVLGHTVGGSIAGIYDRHHYRDEIADALRRLARLIERIVDGKPDNVVSLQRAPAVQP